MILRRPYQVQQFVKIFPAPIRNFLLSRGWGGCFKIRKHRGNARLQAQLSTQRGFEKNLHFLRRPARKNKKQKKMFSLPRKNEKPAIQFTARFLKKVRQSLSVVSHQSLRAYFLFLFCREKLCDSRNITYRILFNLKRKLFPLIYFRKTSHSTISK